MAAQVQPVTSPELSARNRAPLPEAFTTAYRDVQVNETDVELNGGYVELDEVIITACDPSEAMEATTPPVSFMLRVVIGRSGKIADHRSGRVAGSCEESHCALISTPATS
jgi:hypothetical protein